jgi:hypothetical protein
MKARSIITFLAMALLVPVIQLQAGRGGGMRGGGGMRPPMQAPPPATNATAKVVKPGQNKFGDLTNNTTFYFLADTNKTYLWTKISTTTASNTVTKTVTTLKAPTVVNSQ